MSSHDKANTKSQSNRIMRAERQSAHKTRETKSDYNLFIYKKDKKVKKRMWRF